LQPLFGGTVVPGLPLTTSLLQTDARGAACMSFPGGGGPATLFAQFLVLDPAAVQGVSLSNAVSVGPCPRTLRLPGPAVQK